MEGDRKRLEKEYAESLAEALDLEDYAAWQLHAVPHRVSVHRNAVLVLWRWHADGTPEMLDAFTVTGIDLSWSRGLEIMLEASSKGRSTWSVGQRPTRLANGEIFVWTPYFPDIRYEPKPEGEGWLLRASLCMRMKSHPDTVVAGDSYLMPVGEFRGRFPQYKNIRF